MSEAAPASPDPADERRTGPQTDPTLVRPGQDPSGTPEEQGPIGFQVEKGDNLFVVTALDNRYVDEPATETRTSIRPHVQLPNVAAGQSLWHTRLHFTQDEAIAVEKTRLPRLRRVSHGGHGWTAIERISKGVKRDRKVVPSVALDVYGEDGRGGVALVDMVYVPLDDFMNYGNVQRPAPATEPESQTEGGAGSATGAGQAEAPPAEQRFRHEEVGLRGVEGEGVWGKIRERQTELRLPDLQGLTWTERNDDNPRDSRTYQIVRDTRIYTPTPQEPKYIPAWIAIETDARGRVIGRQVFKDDILQKRFKEIVDGPDPKTYWQDRPPNRTLLDMHWDVAVPSQPLRPEERAAREQMSPEERAWLGWKVLKVVNGRVVEEPETEKAEKEVTGLRHLTASQLLNYFGSGDIYGEKDGKRRASKLRKKHEVEFKAASNALNGTVAEMGSDAVEARAKHVMSQYQRGLKAMEVALGTGAKVPHELRVEGSLAFLYEMSVMSHEARNAKQKAANDPSIDVKNYPDPFGEDEEAVIARRLIVQKHLGQAFETIVIKEDKTLEQLKEVNDQGQPIAKPITVRQPVPEIIRHLPILVQEDINDRLRKSLGKKGDGKLSDADYVWLGDKLQEGLRL
jgi:hypothetical protein